MHLTEQQTNEFISLYERKFGVRLSREEAMQKGIGLCRFVDLVVHDAVQPGEDIVDDLEYCVGPRPTGRARKGETTHSKQ